ncbi:MAG: VOC family protein [Flavobacteriales bacterium]
MKIQELEIYTPRLEEQTKFYSQVLELDSITKTNTSVSFQIGKSILKLIRRDEFTPYHYAINIPANQEVEALKWLKERVDVLKYENSMIQYFDFWNAYAIYFYDADKNIVELIARKNLENNSRKPFSKNALLEISEIGMPTFDINKEYKVLKEIADIAIHSGNLERFCALGDENGLFIAINKEEKKEWFPTKDKPFSSDFNIRFIEKGNEFTFQYKNEELNAVAKTN